MSSNLCPRCHKPIRIPQEEVDIVRTKTRHKGLTEDRMVHKVCPTTEPVSGVGGQEYCSNCGHARPMHSPRCQYSSYEYRCDCKEFRK